MMPNNILSSTSLPSTFLPPRDIFPRDPLVDEHLGGIALNDASQGLQVQVWTATVDGSDNIVVSAPSAPSPQIIVNVPDVDWLGLAFDTNMRIFLCWTVGAVAQYRWFDVVGNAFVITTLPAGSVRPMCALDDARPALTSSADILLCYVRSNTLFMRMQRDRYGTEYTLADVTGLTFNQVGMNHTNRFQFEF
jgi:hypothetical protein